MTNPCTVPRLGSPTGSILIIELNETKTIMAGLVIVLDTQSRLQTCYDLKNVDYIPYTQLIADGGLFVYNLV